MFKDQIELEKHMVDGGRESARLNMSTNENKGRAHTNRYANTVYGRFVEPLANKIRADMEKKGPGKYQSHIVLLGALEPEAVAYIAVRCLLVKLLEESGFGNGREVFYMVGKAVQSETVMRQFEDMDQEAFFYLQEELERRQSQDLRHRITLVNRKIRERGQEPIDWGHGSREQVGAYLCEILSVIGMIDIDSSRVNQGKGCGKRSHTIKYTVTLSDGLTELIEQVRELVEQTTSYYLPCIEPPKDWVSMHDGGYHTQAMRKMSNCSAVIGGGKGQVDCSFIFKSLNCLQQVKWKINDKVLEIAKGLARLPTIGTVEDQEKLEIITGTFPGKPVIPDFMEDIENKEDMTPEQHKEFKRWKMDTSEWHTQIRLRKQQMGRMANVFRIADQCSESPEIYFVYHCDFRGRAYPFSKGPNPQGSDLQKGVLHFAEGKALRGDEAKFWFLCHGASKFGIDKVSLDDRVKWVKDNHDMIMMIANDPVENNDWLLQADKPFQFLAWVLEYAEFVKYGAAFESHLPVSLDGSCNGLQNFSALLLDEVGGEATNLTPGGKPKDIYQTVADRTMVLLRELAEDDRHYRSRWIAHSVTRKLVKRSVMTLPYGSTRYSASDFILKDYVRKEHPVEFDKSEYTGASQYLAGIVWQAIGDVVIKAREAMEFLQRSSGKILENYKDIRWVTPNGLVVIQDYRSTESAGRVRINLFGGAMFRYSTKTDKPDAKRHKNGLSPNFIHSMDAAHMQRVVVKAYDEGITSMAAIHDDFGVHAADTPRFNEIIREEFVNMYQQDEWLSKFAYHYIDAGCDLGMPPEPGNLDISQVIDSKYFFC